VHATLRFSALLLEGQLLSDVIPVLVHCRCPRFHGFLLLAMNGRKKKIAQKGVLIDPGNLSDRSQLT
jgi:hypothetical protein